MAVDGVSYIWAVYSKTQDELTLNNRSFETYEQACDYAKELDDMFGLSLFVGPIRIPFIPKTQI